MSNDRLPHRIICEIAFLELEPTARERVKAMIRRDPEFDTFAESCSWPDHPRHRDVEHYVNLPRNATGFGDDPCPSPISASSRRSGRAADREPGSLGDQVQLHAVVQNGPQDALVLLNRLRLAAVAHHHGGGFDARRSEIFQNEGTKAGAPALSDLGVALVQSLVGTLEVQVYQLPKTKPPPCEGGGFGVSFDVSDCSSYVLQRCPAFELGGPSDALAVYGAVGVDDAPLRSLGFIAAPV